MSRKRNNMMGGRKNSRRNRKNTRRNNMMGGRKNTRRNNMNSMNMMGGRKNSRRNNMNSMNMMGGRKNTRRNNMNSMNMMGGEYNPMKLSLAQGEEYLDAHIEQHGGGALTGAPVDYNDSRLLPADLVPSSRTGSLDAALQEIQGMSDFGGQSGGRRRKSKKSKKASRKSKKSRKASRKSKKSRKASRKSKKSRKASRKSRRMYGGALAGAPYNSPNMLLSASQAAKAGTADFSNPLLKY